MADNDPTVGEFADHYPAQSGVGVDKAAIARGDQQMILNWPDPGEQDIARSAGTGSGYETAAFGDSGKSRNLLRSHAVGFGQGGGPTWVAFRSFYRGHRSTWTRGMPPRPSISSVIAQTSASARSGERPGPS